jgi:rod shape-determining protein MreB and related proteins
MFLSASKPDLAIDFGTANTRVVTAEGGVVFDEPSLCCFTGGPHNAVLAAAGEAVRPMLDRTSGSTRVVRPLNRGVLSDIGAARDFLAYAVRSSLGQRRLRSYRALIGIPADATNAERGALLTAASDAGLRSVELVAEPLAAALGAGITIDLPRGAMIVECGAGTTEAAVLSLGDICVTASVRGGGDALDGAICDFLHFRHKFLIGMATAEATKRELVRLIHEGADGQHDIRIKGRNLATGRPDAVYILATDLLPVIDKHVTAISSMVVNLLGQISPELSRDIHDQGIVLTGGGAEVSLVGSAIGSATGLTVQLADDHGNCVARGLQRALLH